MQKLFKNTDIAPLVLFRICLGFLMACESFGAIYTKWVYNVFLRPQFTFPFIGFEWLQPLKGNGMYYYFIIMGVFGLLVMLGYRYVLAIIGFTVMWAGVYFMQKDTYNNHYYLLLIISFFMIFLPANKDLSLDVKFKLTTRQTTIPVWMIYLFILQMGIVYTYAAIAKLYPGWIDGTFTSILLQNSTRRPFFLNLFAQKWVYLSVAYVGILFDFLIVPLLLYKKTRLLAIIGAFCFHIFNAIVLQIGIFPFFALSFLFFFFDGNIVRQKIIRNTISIENNLNYNRKNVLTYLMIPFIIIQLLLPLRQHLIEGDVIWTEEAHRLSWRMMLRERNGFINIFIKDNKTGITTNYNYSKNLTTRQIQRIATLPDFLWQYCQRIKEEYKNQDISIYVDCQVSVNRAPYKPLIKRNFDMSKAKWDYFNHNEWVNLN